MAWDAVKRIGFLGIGFGLTVAACAVGSQSSDLDEDDNGGGSGAQGPGSTGAQMSVGGAGGMSNPVTTTTSSSGGGMVNNCSEQPCKLTSPQCGCDAGQKCTLDSTDGSRLCINDGTVLPGEICSGANCAAGALCVSIGDGNPSNPLCRKFCTSDADCPGIGGVCFLTLADNMMNTIPDAMCTENCDPVSLAGCPTGTKCVVFSDMGPPARTFTSCTSQGAGTQNQPCTDTYDCAAGFGCFTNSQTMIASCMRYANQANPNCPAGSQYTDLNPPLTIGSVTYGACITP